MSSGMSTAGSHTPFVLFMFVQNSIEYLCIQSLCGLPAELLTSRKSGESTPNKIRPIRCHTLRRE
jgi:hypothetical protein